MKNRRHGRWYGDGSDIAFGMELLGERWTALIIRELIYGPMRFSELAVELHNISAKVLAERLASMMADGIICRAPQLHSVHLHTYSLTSWGKAAAPIVEDVARWAVKSSSYDKTLPQSSSSLMTLLKISFDPTVIEGMDMKVGLITGSSTFVVDIKNGKIDIHKNQNISVDFQISSSEPATLRSLLLEKTALVDTDVKFDGPHLKLKKFISAFSSI